METMKDKKTKLCPMLKNSTRIDGIEGQFPMTKEYFRPCIEGVCAWWVGGSCAVAAIAIDTQSAVNFGIPRGR